MKILGVGNYRKREGWYSSRDLSSHFRLSRQTGGKAIPPDWRVLKAHDWHSEVCKNTSNSLLRIN